eukprot:gene3606-4925_t
MSRRKFFHYIVSRQGLMFFIRAQAMLLLTLFFGRKTSNTHISMNHFVKSQVEFQSVVAAMNWGNKSISNGNQLTNPSNLANLTGYFTSEHSGPKVGIGYSAPSMPPMFTFVRDPLQRFVAGFVESVMRTLNPVKQDLIPNFDPLGDLYRIPLRPPPRDSRDRRTLLAASDAAPSISSRNIRLVNVSIVEKYLYYFFSLDNRL